MDLSEHPVYHPAMGGTDILLATALALNLAGYATYLVGLRRHLVEPNRASWLIWSVATAVEAATYAAINPGAPQALVFALSAAACLVVTLVMWRRSRWRAPTPLESSCMGAALVAILLWLALHQAFWAHMLVVAAVPVSFWPTWASVWEDVRRERSPAWGLWTLGDLATLLVAARVAGTATGEYAYILVEFGCHAAVWLMIGLASLNPARSLGVRRGAFYLLDAYRTPANPFAVGESHLGRAVFAARGFAAGDLLIRFSGPRVRADRLPTSLHGAADRFVQIAAGEYLGPSGRIDDLVNHSCDPNAGIRFRADGIFLVALRPIAPGEEIAWDYATTVSDPSWRMPCACGSPACRGVIGAFDTLPDDRRRWYRAHDLVAPHLREQPPADRAA
ncbi:SET domain-containing protein [Sphingomonas rubra]|uniref:SET domain-containing protein n=1 Tax=Sphingomonas rubra TaxID=634430 RepID=A0A1I5QU49_9SPHN|nr:SET domain-containing protein [Sphingomonas rubra]SFP49814.1 SET domain-containing protein [Sphingomonas rubra]